MQDGNDVSHRVNSVLRLTEDHLRHALAAGHHREDVLGLVGDEIHEHQVVLARERFAAARLDVRRLLDPHADVAVGLGELHEVGQRVHVGLGVAVAVEELLPLAHHAHVAVVQVHDLDRQAVLLAGGELLDAHLDRGLAGDAGHVGVRDGRAARPSRTAGRSPWCPGRRN